MKQSKSTLKKIKLMIPLVLMTAVLGACSSNASSSTTSSSNQTANATSTSQTKTNTSDYFASEDSDASYDESKATTISLSGSSAKTSGEIGRAHV